MKIAIEDKNKQMKKLNRRNFLKISGASLGGLLVSGPVMSQVVKSLDPTKLKIAKYATYCEVCFWKCAGWAYTDEKGEIWKINGNPEDPNCHGRFCPRGTGGVGMYTDPDRLKNPLLRKTVNGSQVFEEVSWDEAFTFIGNKMKDIAEKHGPESIALFKHGSGGAHFANLMKAFGTTNFAAPSYAQCRGPREVAFENTFGKAINSPEPTDIRNTKCLVLIGSHLGENMHNTQVQELAMAMDKGATIITVDPRCSTVASKSKYWLPIKPATDMALLLAWIHVIINEDLYDKKYVEKYAIGFDELKAHVEYYNPEWAAQYTNLKAEDIRKTAWEMAAAAPSVIVHPGRHVTWYGDDTQRLRAVAILNALLGSWGRKGGFYFPQAVGLPSFPHPAYPKPKWSWKDTLEGKYPLAGLAVSNALIDASHPNYEGKNKIKSWFIVGTNLVKTVPNKQYTIEALQNQELVVAVDILPMEITGYADVILPECSYLERYDYSRTGPARIPSIAVRTPAAEPKFNSKPASWMVKELSKKLGLESYFEYEDFSEVLDYQFMEIGSSLAAMKQAGVKTFPAPGNLYLEEDEDYKFNTPSGKIELYSKTMEEAGFEPLPDFTWHPEPDEGYFRLNYGRAPMHTFSRTTNNPNLTTIMAENTLWINPDVAKGMGLTEKQEVWLENQDGIVSTFSIKLNFTERMNKESVYMIHGFGHSDSRLKNSYGKGICDSELITNVMVDPIMGGTGMRGNFVKIHTQKPRKEAKS